VVNTYAARPTPAG